MESSAVVRKHSGPGKKNDGVIIPVPANPENSRRTRNKAAVKKEIIFLLLFTKILKRIAVDRPKRTAVSRYTPPYSRMTEGLTFVPPNNPGDKKPGKKQIKKRIVR